MEKTTDLLKKKLEVSWEHFMKNGHDKGQKWLRTQKKKRLRRGGKNAQN